jgi:hypothetical protein
MDILQMDWEKYESHMVKWHIEVAYFGVSNTAQ